MKPRLMSGDIAALCQKPFLSIAEAAQVLGWGTSEAHQVARRGELPGVVTVNGRLHGLTKVLLRWLDGDVSVPPDSASGSARAS